MTDKRLLVDRLRVADHSRNRAEADGDPQRAGVGVIGQRTVENLRVEFVGLAIDVEIGARKQSPQQRRAEPDAGQEQFVDEGVLGAPEGQRVEPGRFEETVADSADPECGELKTSGEVRRAGSIVSTGGSNSDQLRPSRIRSLSLRTHCALALGAGIGFIIWDALGDGAQDPLPSFKEFLPGRRKVASLNRG